MSGTGSPGEGNGSPRGQSGHESPELQRTGELHGQQSQDMAHMFGSGQPLPGALGVEPVGVNDDQYLPGDFIDIFGQLTVDDPEPEYPPPPLAQPVLLGPAFPAQPIPDQPLPQEIQQYYQNIAQHIAGVTENDRRVLYFNTPSLLLIRQIGHGAYGIVCTGMYSHEPNRRRQPLVAIKIVREVLDPRELHAIDQIHAHPPSDYICRFFGHYVTADTTYIISEYSVLGDLLNQLHVVNQAGQLEWRQLAPVYCRHVIHQVALGLDYMFNVIGMAHCDVKLQNILVFWGPRSFDRRLCWRLKLTDFSHSVLFPVGGNSLVEHPLCSEQTAPPQSYDPSSWPYGVREADMYSLGACLLAMLSGRYCFHPELVATDQTLEASIDRKYDMRFVIQQLANYHFMLRQLLVRLLDPNPVTRMTIDQFFDNQWLTLPINSVGLELEYTPDDLNPSYAMPFPQYIQNIGQQP